MKKIVFFMAGLLVFAAFIWALVTWFQVGWTWALNCVKELSLEQCQEFRLKEIVFQVWQTFYPQSQPQLLPGPAL
ncbi:MAG: hypothetical protein UX26_C0018G0005 [Parcubacteria group bacterium GW2011_GWC1_45_9]|uniref:Uncharacterized protein n=1 Tax=Candidatus Woesebacteria bacterium GW2011_GWB1_44_11b TaxID=1618580 RepID=A0A0G1GGN3_9BACT|nr:MAG: hypothetical protein UW21_C0004G0006 [Candidatus Woesebacteria bacterium GW2011_GWB1_44_11b]KKT86424.1 MAG: hypothetical protein UW85_C0002G0025 [Parcubacteria group bacterium GW2011_GWA1_Parcubacteria_45_10]KKU16683.1 MAG: hypothetical protein UX26_C0018G0005 [Parcubacteria group bacterium GW2011_GWC1_45_9]HCI05430.1 hypothetical protein [Patescibacteria group bacterium]